MAVSAGLAYDAGALAIRIPAAIVHDEQVQLAVIVIIEPAGRNRPRFSSSAIRQPRRCRNILKRSVAAVVKEHIAIYARDKQVSESIVVEIRCRNARREAFAL